MVLESISNSMSSKPTPKSSLEGKGKVGSSKASDYLLQMKTEDKSKAIIRTDSGSKLPKIEEKKHQEFKREEKKSEETKLSTKKEDKKKEENQKEDAKKDEIKKDEDKKAMKRPSTDNDFKIKIKSPAQL